MRIALSRLVPVRLAAALAAVGFPLLAVGCSTCSGMWANNRGVDYYRAGNYGAAQQEFATAASYDLYNADYYYNLACAQHKMGSLLDAETNYNSCLDRDPMHQACHHALATLLIEEGRHAEAQALLEGWAATMPYIPEPSVELAWFYRQTGRYAEAQTQAMHALRIDPQHPQALALMGQLSEDLGQTDRALVLYDRALAGDPTQEDVRMRMTQLEYSGRASPATVQMVRQNSGWLPLF